MLILLISLCFVRISHALDDVESVKQDGIDVLINDSEGSTDDDKIVKEDAVQSVDEEIPLPDDNSDDPLLKKKTGKKI
jgi:hypothetical protein